MSTILFACLFTSFFANGPEYTIFLAPGRQYSSYIDCPVSESQLRSELLSDILLECYQPSRSTILLSAEEMIMNLKADLEYGPLALSGSTQLITKREVHSLTVTSDLTSDTFILHWFQSHDFDDGLWGESEGRSWKISSRSKTRSDENSDIQLYTRKRRTDVNFAESYVILASFKHSVHYDLSCVRLTGNIQDDLFNIPFTGGVAPNWQKWIADDLKGVSLLEGRKEGVQPVLHPETPDQKMFFQLIQSSNEGGCGGAVRDFVGLSSGHRYRIAIRLNTLSMDNSIPDWHAAVSIFQKNIDNLETISMQEFEQIQAHQTLVTFNNEHITKNNWIVFSTGTDAEKMPDIVVNENLNCIRVLVSLTAQGVASGIGVDWISLEDLGTNASVSVE